MSWHVLPMVCVALTVAPCVMDDPLRDVIGVINDTHQVAEVFYAGGEAPDDPLVEIGPGQSLTLPPGSHPHCTSDDLIAKNPDGEIIEIRPPEVCIGTFWTINGDPRD